jgi:hypothetical protein
VIDASRYHEEAAKPRFWALRTGTKVADRTAERIVGLVGCEVSARLHAVIHGILARFSLLYR